MYFVEDLNSVHDISKGSRERNWPLSGDTHCVSGKKKKHRSANFLYVHMSEHFFAFGSKLSFRGISIEKLVTVIVVR